MLSPLFKVTKSLVFVLGSTCLLASQACAAEKEGLDPKGGWMSTKSFVDLRKTVKVRGSDVPEELYVDSWVCLFYSKWALLYQPGQDFKDTKILAKPLSGRKDRLLACRNFMESGVIEFSAAKADGFSGIYGDFYFSEPMFGDPLEIREIKTATIVQLVPPHSETHDFKIVNNVLVFWKVANEVPTAKNCPRLYEPESITFHIFERSELDLKTRKIKTTGQRDCAQQY